MSLTPCDYIAENMGELFDCSPVGDYTRIRTPYLYPDGDIIDLFLSQTGNDSSTLTDLGETLGWLRTQTVSERKTDRQRRLIEDVCLTHGVELYRGMLMVRVKDFDEMSEAISRLSQTALRVSDLWFTFRNQAAASINDEVEEFLAAQEIQFERGERLVGRSGRTWRVDFHTRTSEKSALVNVLSTGSRPSARRMAEHTLATWHDLSNLQIGPESLRFISLFDDELDVWAPEDFGLVEDVSEVAYWSHKDEFAELLIS
jgi:hypothetical protein